MLRLVVSLLPYIIPGRCGSGSRQNTGIVGYECTYSPPLVSHSALHSQSTHSLTHSVTAATSLTFLVCCCSCSLLILDPTDGRTRADVGGPLKSED